MPLVIMTAKVENATEWEQKFRSRGELFRKVWPGPVPHIHFATTDGNEVVLCTDVDDAEAYFEMIARPEITAAMEGDGVRRDTVRVFVLDKVASY